MFNNNKWETIILYTVIGEPKVSDYWVLINHQGEFSRTIITTILVYVVEFATYVRHVSFDFLSMRGEFWRALTCKPTYCQSNSNHYNWLRDW